uniref:Cysteine-rich secretory protein n=1 Tax=Hadrurus spadix TaxID=141984 RepID=A0A1W7RAS5_9SCOR
MIVQLLLSFALFSWDVASSQTCPEIYLRFSKDHTYCLRSNCHVIKRGVTEEDKKIILDIHNEFRNKIALGQETSPRQQPPAANMIQMEWDNELAEIAQAHSDQCIFEHDNAPQRQVENFPVGQNLLITMLSKTINWRKIRMWYTSEINYFYPQYRQPFTFATAYGHFSQMVWAKTWKVGCGVSVFYDNVDNMDKVLYTCNYGPAGNMRGDAVYSVGAPCSQCPKNTQCSNEYKGLCKSLTPDGPQKEISISSRDFLLYCNFSVNDSPGCRNVQISGSKPFQTKKLYSGEYKTAILNGGESITIKLGKAQDNRGICPFVYGSFGPNRDGDAKRSAVSIGFSAPRIMFGDPVKIEYGSSEFWTVGILMRFSGEMESTIKLQAYPGASPQYFNVKSFGIGRGKCPKF